MCKSTIFFWNEKLFVFLPIEIILSIMKRIVSFLLIMTCVCALRAQSYSDAFDDAFRHDDVAGQRQALALWQQEAPEDVNLFIARYNFYANRAMGQNPDVVIAPLADSGLVAIEEGIGLFPDRLDLRFGKIYFLGQLHRWDAFVGEIVRTMDYSAQIGHRWSYPNVPDDMMEDLLLEGVVDYMVEMFANIADTAHLTAADSLMARRLREVAKRTVQLFPGDFASTYMLALSHLMLNESDKAYKYLVRAEGLNSTHAPLLQSLVKVCRLLGKTAQAKEYQRRLSQLGD